LNNSPLLCPVISNQSDCRHINRATKKMKKSTQAIIGAPTVHSVLFCDQTNQILQFETLKKPVLREELNVEQISKVEFAFALCTLSDKTEFVYTPQRLATA
jgi:hypothetical protein